MNRIRVFLGPTMGIADARQIASFDFQPPAKRGDIYRAVVYDQVDAIGLVDGFYDSVPAVLHREILFALSNGVALYGAASIGAIRAAELERFGMVGVGAIFRDYLTGALTGDDEVAIIHAPAELNYSPLVDALVNIRATLRAAIDAHVVEPDAAELILQIGKSKCFRERKFRQLVEEAAVLMPSGIDKSKLCDWASKNWIDQKAIDARQLLVMLGKPLQRPSPFPFIATTQWLMAIEDIDVYA